MNLFIHFLVFFVMSASLSANALKDTQRIAADSLRTNEARKRVAAENMANAQSADYKPKSIYVTPKRKKGGYAGVEVKRIQQDGKKMIQKYDPSHPKADADGYVSMPDINPMVELMNIQRSKHESERALKVYELATDLRHKTIGLMSGR